MWCEGNKVKPLKPFFFSLSKFIERTSYSDPKRNRTNGQPGLGVYLVLMMTVIKMDRHSTLLSILFFMDTITKRKEEIKNQTLFRSIDTFWIFVFFEIISGSVFICLKKENTSIFNKLDFFFVLFLISFEATWSGTLIGTFCIFRNQWLFCETSFICYVIECADCWVCRFLSGYLFLSVCWLFCCVANCNRFYFLPFLTKIAIKLRTSFLNFFPPKIHSRW